MGLSGWRRGVPHEKGIHGFANVIAVLYSGVHRL